MQITINIFEYNLNKHFGTILIRSNDVKNKKINAQCIR